MKNYKEMARCVLEARDAHDRQVRRRRVLLRRCAPVAAGFCFAVLIGFGVWQQKQELPRIPPQEHTEASIEATTNETVETTHMQQSHLTSEPLVQEATTAAPAQSSTPETDAPETTEAATQPTVNLPPAVPEPTTMPTMPPEPPTEAPIESPSETEPSSETKSVVDEDPKIFEAKPWNEMTIDQQFFMAEFGEPLRFYQTAEKVVEAGEVGDYLCDAYMSGYDWFADVYYHCAARAYQIKGHPIEEVIAIQFADDETYYLYTLAGGAEDASEG